MDYICRVHLVLLGPGDSQSTSSASGFGVVKWLLCKTRDAGAVSLALSFVVPRRTVHGDSALMLAHDSAISLTLSSTIHLPVVPNGRRPRRPPETTLDVDVALVDAEQVVQDGIALALVQPDNPQRHGAVDIQRLPARHGVHLIVEATSVSSDDLLLRAHCWYQFVRPDLL